jgi:hypothetical protein
VCRLRAGAIPLRSAACPNGPPKKQVRWFQFGGAAVFMSDCDGNGEYQFLPPSLNEASAVGPTVHAAAAEFSSAGVGKLALAKLGVAAARVKSESLSPDWLPSPLRNSDASNDSVAAVSPEVWR